MSYPIKPVTPQINRRLAKLYGVVAAFPFAERGGTTARDVAGSRNATINGGTWGTGPFGPQLTLNGSSDYVQAASSAAWELSAPCSFSAWITVNWGSAAYNPCILSCRDAGGTRYSFHVGDSGSPGFTTKIGLWNGTSYLSATGAAFSKNVPHFWTAVCLGTTTTFYLDGAPFGSPVSLVPSGTTAKPLNFGFNGAAAEYFQGVVDAPILYNRALTASQVLALYLDPWALYRPDKRNVFAIQRLSGLLLARRRAMLIR